MFPKMNRQPTRTVSVPELSGGINLRDSVSMIADNQLTDGVNVWYKDAVLKTRPGLKAIKHDRITYDQSDREFKLTYAISRPTDIYCKKDGKRYQLFSAAVGEGWEQCIYFYLVSGDDVIELSTIYNPDNLDENGVLNYFVFEHKQNLYCYITTDYPEDHESGKFVILVCKNWVNMDNEWQKIEESEIYIPLVAINCEMEGVADLNIGDSLKKATYFEGYNLLSSRYRMQYNMDTANGNHEFELLHDMGSENENITASLVGQKVIATTTNKWGGVCHHEVTLTGEDYFDEESDYGTDGLKMRACSTYIDFIVNKGYENSVEESFDGLKNCLEIEAPFVQSPEEKAKVFKMTQQTWFGGTSAGINGGTRLFLCGNTDQQEKSLVVWSDLNNPLYFPKNNCFYVGNSSQAVTGFGKQNEMLVLFKENEIFYTYYKQGGEYSANDLISQSVIDVTSASAYFPLIQIHGSIGCDCPNTIQLCRNRLVWATSYGKVYTLATNDQYSERNIYEISEMMERRLKKEDDLKHAFACDWNEHYLLFSGHSIYVMDYNSYGYQYAYSYSKTEDSNLKIPWWYWEIPDFSENNAKVSRTVYCVNTTDDSIIIGIVKMIETETEEAGTVRYFYNEIYKIDTAESKDSVYLHDLTQIPVSQYNYPTLLGMKEKPIQTSLQTKIFDFGVPQRNKAINLVNVSFGNNGGEPISLKYITENGEYPEEAVRLRMDDTTEYSAGYVRNKPFRPCIGLVNRFGLRLECQGDMAVDAISIDYRLTGRSK